MSKTANELIEYLRSGAWIDKMSPEENILLADYLKTSMAKQRKKVAFAERIKDGVVYVIYKVRYRKNDSTLDLVVPGEVCIHRDGDELPTEITGVPRIAFSTLFCLGEIVENQ
jgi:hypothetical protein